MFYIKYKCTIIECNKIMLFNTQNGKKCFTYDVYNTHICTPSDAEFLCNLVLEDISQYVDVLSNS